MFVTNKLKLTNQDCESVTAESQSYFEHDTLDVNSVIQNSAVVVISLYYHLLEEFNDCNL